MKESFPGYYHPSESDFQHLWSSSTFAFDTNALLNLYRSSAETQTSFLGILDLIKDRIWLPHQVGKEFHENKLDAIWHSQQAYSVVRSELEHAVTKFERLVENYKEHPRLNVAELLGPIKVAEQQIKDILQATEKQHPNLMEADKVGEEIAKLFEGKVGKPYPQEEFDKRCKEAERRYAEGIPPGFKDQKKDGTRKYGDVIIWFQLRDYAQSNKSSLVFVTADAKEDWWYQHKGRTIGPRPELIQEMMMHAGIKFYMYTPPEFVRHAKTHLKATPADSLDRAAEELNQIETQKRAFDWSTWNDFLTGIRIGNMHHGESWSTFLGTLSDRERGWLPNSELLQYLQQNLHEVPIVKKAILEGEGQLVAFGPWPCECGRLIAALGHFSSGAMAMGFNGIRCKCGRMHPLPASLYRGFCFEDEWHEITQ